MIEETVWFNDATTCQSLPTAVLTGTGASASISYISTHNLGSPHIITDSNGTKLYDGTWKDSGPDHRYYFDGE